MLYIDGKRLYRGFLAGSKSVLLQREFLNSINVFPVPDADTGANLAATLQNTVSASKYTRSIKETAVIMADNALAMARGNSGIIFSQFLYGVSREMGNEYRLSLPIFAQVLQRSVSYMYHALMNPMEGTMITVIKDWAESMLQYAQNSNDLLHILERSLISAKASLADTKKKLAVLKNADVVDAGGMGFVVFLEGIIRYLKTGKIQNSAQVLENYKHLDIHPELPGKYRFCCETLLTNLALEPAELADKLLQSGDSLALAGDKDKLHLHIHANKPTEIFHIISQLADINNVKVDDMIWQHEIQENKKFKIGLITDSAADFPQKFISEYQINTIPIKIIFGNDIFLDKVTIDSKTFFDKIESGSDFPHSSQPDSVQIGSIVDFVSSHYDEVISIPVSSQLSGVYNLLNNAGNGTAKHKVFDSRHLSVSQGLLVLRTAQAIKDGWDYQSIIDKLPLWRDNTWIFTDIHSLDYLVRGGRISPLKGKLAQLLNLKPIVTVDKTGKGAACGKSFSRKNNMKKIIKLVLHKANQGILWNYAIVHAKCPERADKYAAKLTSQLGKEPLYIMDIGPVVGVHNGPGACAVGLIVE